MNQLKTVSETQLFNKVELLNDFRKQRWFAQQNVDVDGFDIVDWALIPNISQESEHKTQESLYWLKIQVANTHTYSVLISQHQNKLKDAASHSGFIEYLKLICTEGLLTNHGATLRLIGDIHHQIITDIKTFEAGSSNTLHYCNTQESPLNQSSGLTAEHQYVLKSYRLLDASEGNEVKTLQALSKHQITPCVVGVIEYQHATGVDYLGVMTEMVHGEPIHKLYSQAIRTLISDLNSGAKNALDVESATTPVQTLSRKIGKHTCLLHQQLNHSYASEIKKCPSGFDFTAFLTRIKNQWRGAYQAVKHDQSIGEQCRHNVLQMLRQCAKRLLKVQHSVFQKQIPVSIAHNDLHLAHVFVDANDDYCRIIDPSPLSLKAKEAGFSEQLSLTDLVSLHRGLEYFSFDEIVDAIAHYLDLDANDVALNLLLDPQKLEIGCPHLFPLMACWSAQVVDELNVGYQDISLESGLLSKAEQKLLYDAFYFSRLLQELDYNYAYGRQFFKLCDLYYLQQFTKEITQ